MLCSVAGIAPAIPSTNASGAKTLNTVSRSRMSMPRAYTFTSWLAAYRSASSAVVGVAIGPRHCAHSVTKLDLSVPPMHGPREPGPQVDVTDRQHPGDARSHLSAYRLRLSSGYGGQHDARRGQDGLRAERNRG